MLKKDNESQEKMFIGTIEDLMPKVHFLRDLDRFVDFNFIYEKVESLYSNIGRPSIDPVVLVKMLLIGYLYNIDSERKLEQEICVNIAYRWFIGLELGDSVPDHSTISQLRRRKFSGSTVFQDIFDEVVRKCMEAGLVSGKLLLTDSTHIRANARNDRREIIEVPDTPSEYMKKLDREAYENGLIKDPIEYKTPKTKHIVKSTTDPECGMLNRPGKPEAFCYLNHETCDAEHGIITDVYVTPGNANDAAQHTSRIEYQIDKFGFETECVCADGAYDSSEIYDAMDKRNIKTYIPTKDTVKHSRVCTDEFDTDNFSYDKDKNVYICPMCKELHYSGYSKSRRKKKYCSKKRDCINCPHKDECCRKNEDFRIIERHMHHEAREKQTKNVDTPEYRQAMRARRIWCEGNFSHQKEQHNLRRTRKRDIEKVTEQCLLSACALNLKRLVAALIKRLSTNLNYWFFIRLVLSKRISFFFQGFVNSTICMKQPLFGPDTISVFYLF